MVYRSPFTLEKQTSCITQYYSISLSSDSLFEELIEGKYSLTSVQASDSSLEIKPKFSSSHLAFVFCAFLLFSFF